MVTSIPRADVGVVSEAITLNDSGVLTKFAVDISVTHPEISMLKVELISPDNQLYVLHDGPNGSGAGQDLNALYPPRSCP